MFSSNRRPDRPEYEPVSAASGSGATVIARGVKVEGDFVSQGDVVIEGEVNGHVMASGLLSVGVDAKLKAEVAADDAVIAGLVEGTVTVKKRLELKATAKIMGDVVCETAAIEAGAVLHGKCSIGQGKPGKEPSKQHPTAAEKPAAA
jgi:cytoskeletal protein CcmA (bactofilin family)